MRTIELQSAKNFSFEKVAVYQSLLDGQSDTGDKQINIDIKFGKRDGMLSVPLGFYSPLSTRGVLWTRNAFWGLIIPPSPDDDIAILLRSTILQHVLSSFEKHTALISPVAEEKYNTRNFTGKPFYKTYRKVRDLIEIFRSTDLKMTGDPIERMEIVLKFLHKDELLTKVDIEVYKTWFKALRLVQYNHTLDPLVSRQRNVLSLDTQKRDPRVVVCVSGQLRTLTLPLDSPDHPHAFRGKTSSYPPPNMTVAESIQKFFFPKLGKPDIFISITSREGPHEPRIGNLSVCDPLRSKLGRKYLL